ncbi:acetyltransferase [Evansella halocellulosilytica]|uniref:acetyltransferase n=1 Tax=Evansella halocellulosilytica TaxID=2011013 RepID=UPI000BB82F86|nr:acetyltransferase [Evansella halocellulosilytica]
MKQLFIIGSGGFSKQVIEIVENINKEYERYELVGLIDDDERLIGQEVLGYKIIGTTDYLKRQSKKCKVYGAIAIANGNVRREITKKIKDINWVNLIHPSSIVSKYTNIGVGNIICAGTIINPNFKLGNHCHINIGTTIGHDGIIEDYITVMPGSKISGNVTIKYNSTIGTGSTILQGLIIEKNVTLGAGCVLTKNTIENSMYIGVPAKKVKNII